MNATETKESYKILAKEWADMLRASLPAVNLIPGSIRALLVMVTTDHIRDYLAENDMMALRQAMKAIDGHFGR